MIQSHRQLAAPKTANDACFMSSRAVDAMDEHTDLSVFCRVMISLTSLLTCALTWTIILIKHGLIIYFSALQVILTF